MTDITKVKDIHIGMKVEISASSGPVIGIVSKILTSIDNIKGIKVQLDTGEKGRITKIINEHSVKVKKQETKKILNIKEIDKPIIINIENSDISKEFKSQLESMKQINYTITTKFFQSAYCRSLKSDIYGIVIFKVKAVNITIAIHKINLYLKKFCLTKDLKYEVVKAES